MEINRFYNLRSKLLSSTFQAHPKNLKRTNDLCGDSSYAKCLIKGLYDGIEFPIIFEQKYGSKLLDILDTGPASLYLISNKFKKVLIDHEFTGWKVFDVEVFDKRGQQVFGYTGLSVTGRCGPIDYSKSQIIEKQLVPNGKPIKYYKGQHVGLNTWDESDMFLPEGNTGIVITQEVSNAMKSSKLSNVVLQNLADFEIATYAINSEPNAPKKGLFGKLGF